MPQDSASTYLETVSDNSLSGFQFDQTGGRGKADYLTELNKVIDEQALIQDILGYVSPFVDTTRQAMRRWLPVTHPRYPYLYANNITSITGKGINTAVRVAATQPTNPAIGAKPIAAYLQFKQYEVGVDFTSRPYPLIADASFTNSVTGQWYAKNGTAYTFTYAPEWCRYCDFDLIPCDNTIQGSVGSMSLIDGGRGSGQFVPFTSPPWMWLPDQYLKVRWYQVPYRYIISQNSYIAGTAKAPTASGGGARYWRGRVNQNPWWFWPAGSLLYMGYSVTKYAPPTPDIGTYTGYVPTSTDPNATGSFINYERLCDIELTFLLTSRFMSGTLGATITNKNYVQTGHNLLPNLADNLFYYATRTPPGGTESVQNPPAWFSFPLEALFSDPDATGGPLTNGDN